MVDGRAHRPTLLVTMGVMGSGKSKVFRAAGTKVGFNLDSYVSAVVDDLVTKDEDYQQNVRSILATNDLDHPSDALYQAFHDAYFTARRTPNRDGQTMDDLNDATIFATLAEGRMDLHVELTGTVPPQWLLKASKGQYNVVLACAEVTYETAVERIHRRALGELHRFLRDPQRNPAPRLPKLTRGALHKYGQVLRTLIDTSNERVLVYTNEGTLRLRYDSARRGREREAAVRVG